MIIFKSHGFKIKHLLIFHNKDKILIYPVFGRVQRTNCGLIIAKMPWISACNWVFSACVALDWIARPCGAFTSFDPIAHCHKRLEGTTSFSEKGLAARKKGKIRQF
jgi:hypothetical protein